MHGGPKRGFHSLTRVSVDPFFFHDNPIIIISNPELVYIPLAFLLTHPFYCVFLLPYHTMLYIVFVLTISNAVIAFM